MRKSEKPHAQNYAALVRALAAARPLWALVALVAILAVVSGCAIDTGRIAEKRAEVRALCEGALTPQLRTACAAYGLDTPTSHDVR